MHRQAGDTRLGALAARRGFVCSGLPSHLLRRPRPADPLPPASASHGGGAREDSPDVFDLDGALESADRTTTSDGFGRRLNSSRCPGCTGHRRLAQAPQPHLFVRFAYVQDDVWGYGASRASSLLRLVLQAAPSARPLYRPVLQSSTRLVAPWGGDYWPRGLEHRLRMLFFCAYVHASSSGS